MEIRLLNNIDVKTIHKTFVDAFEDYEVQIKMPFEKFIEMMKTRDLNLNYSAGCFENDKMVGFILSGYREKDGKKYCYDGGTGTVKEYRRKGIGNKLLTQLISELKHKNIDYFILEVLENNMPAIELYKKHGFATTRKLECYECLKKDISKINRHNFVIDNDMQRFRNINHSEYMLYPPSWQNDSISIENSIENYSYVSILHENTLAGYGFIHKTRGDIPQLGILENWQDKGLEEILIHELIDLTASERITVLNVEENNYSGKKLKAMGFINFINQYEMKLDI